MSRSNNKANYSALSSLSLPHFLKTALSDAGYSTLDDLGDIQVGELSIELGVGLAQAEDVLRHVQSYRAGNFHANRESSSRSCRIAQLQAASAAELLYKSASHRYSTFSSALDDLVSSFSETKATSPRDDRTGLQGEARAMEGYISPGMNIEISGPPGIGKTAILIGIMLSARMREDPENGSGEVLVVDTEGGITPDRLIKAAVAASRSNKDTSPERVLQGIHLQRIATQAQMIAFLHALTGWLEAHPKVNLVIIDTLSFHFRQPNLELRTRGRIMDMVKQNIAKATTVHHCAVIVANQLATKLLTAENKPANFDTGDRAVLMPQLGDFWTTAKTVRIVLFRGGPGDDLRYAHASNSAAGQGDVPWASFDIDVDGLPCDLPDDAEPEHADQ